jgi:hypothetical protein
MEYINATSRMLIELSQDAPKVLFMSVQYPDVFQVSRSICVELPLTSPVFSVSFDVWQEVNEWGP